MFTRTTGWLIVPLWLAAMSWLVAHDVWPGLTAQEPPTLHVTDWLRDEGKKSQYAIYIDNDRVGTIWTTYLIDKVSVRREDLVYLRKLPVDVAPLRMFITSVFTEQGVLDEFTLDLVNEQTELRLHGERFHSDFSFAFEMDGVERLYKMPLTDGGVVVGTFNPFSNLAQLHVGQRWRIQVFNPLAALLGALPGIGDRFTSILVEVTGEERIIVDGELINCLVVEAPNAKAWVDARGAVRVQEIDLAVIGKVRVERESEFDEAARRSLSRIRPASSGGRAP